MGMNFQDQPAGEKPQKKPPAPNFNDPQVDNIFIDSPGSGMKVLWIALVVIVIAGAGGGLYLLNKHGYLKFLHKKPAVTLVTATAPPVAAKTTPTPPPPVVAAPAKTKPSAGSFAIQVSAFKSKPLADKYATDLKQQGIDAFVFAGEVPNNGTWFKVCVGPYETRHGAIAAVGEMKKKVTTDAWVVQVQ